MATTNRKWINPPIVYDEINPSNQSMIRMIAIVYNIYFSLRIKF